MAKEIRYLGHAVQKLKERKVTKVQVSEILANPDQVLPARLGRKRAIKLLEGRVIHVMRPLKKSETGCHCEGLSPKQSHK